MNTQKILLPIDTGKCPVEVFQFVQVLAAHCDISVALLNVINLNILAPEARLYDELAGEAHYHLECIAEEYLCAATSKSIRVRFGKPAALAMWSPSHRNLILIAKRSGAGRPKIQGSISVWHMLCICRDCRS